MMRPGRQMRQLVTGRGRAFLLGLCCLLLVALVLEGCDAAGRHKALTTLFDGVPELPETEELCQDYVDQIASAEDAPGGAAAGQTDEEEQGSLHPPYAEKACKNCHDFESSAGLILPAHKLCFSCHEGFGEGKFVHGPVAVGGCLGCHLPHDSQYPALLAAAPEDICARCHREKRLAEGMHTRLGERGMACIECHDPHAGDVHYFLK